MKRNGNTFKTLLSCTFISLSLWGGVGANAFAQAPQHYVDFITGSVADKTALMKSLVIDVDTPELVAALPELALEFLQEQVPIIGTDAGMKELALATIPVLKVSTQRQGALLWNIFGLIDDSQVKVAVLETMTATAGINKRLMSPYLEGVHTFVAEAVASGDGNLAASLVAVNFLGKMADPSSFEILFRLLNSGGNAQLNQAIESSLSEVIPSSQAALLRYISQNSYSMAEKYRLLLLVQKNETISPLFKAEVAEKALSSTTINIGDISKMAPEAISLQLAAVEQIADSMWSRAAETVANYFLMAQEQLEQGLITSQQFLTVVDCLETLATTRSVSALMEYLGVLNTAAAQDVASVNHEVLLAVIESLGALGDKAAFDNLLYVTYLPYPETITTAARTALAGLKW
ncbi:MAG: hypothetical protein IJX45_02770 [Spirochaetaceae bacterium]|nr:hypothetical protein [Spirochaetaceae bacterium]MBQ8561801.1 hypothetical protein [Spirochaetaceae bacterium]